MAVDIPCLVAVVVSYVVILVIGIWAGRKTLSSSNSQFLANRDLGLFVASFTLSATMVGGAYINATAEAVGKLGVIWAVAPICYNVGIFIAAFILAPKVRRAGYTTIFDPLQQRFGKKMGAILFFNELFANLFWEAAILGALGSSLSLILDISINLSVVISACVAVTYTLFGGLYSVAYTDIIQLVFIAVGLIITVPFVYTNDAVDLSRVEGSWVGTLPKNHIAMFVDTIFLCVFGGMPWQVYYQRVLACKTPETARSASLLGTLISVFMLIPPSLVGIAGAATDWTMSSYGGNSSSLTDDEWTRVLPMAMQYLCPTAVSAIGLGAISAAVMSSADSLVLATGSVFARNIYHTIFRPKATEAEVIWVLRLSILVVGAAGTALALTVRSVYALFLLCADLMYVAHFPQVMCAIWLKVGNTYGSLTGFIVGLLIRCVGGEPALNFPVIIKFPMYDESENMQLFPFKTLAMLCSMASIIGISYLTDYIFRRKILSAKFDIFHCFSEDTKTEEKFKSIMLNKDECDSKKEEELNEKLNFLDARESDI